MGGLTDPGVEHGCPSSLSVPLRIDEEDEVTGALNVYAGDADAFDEDSRAMVGRFAPYAAIADGNVHAYQAARDEAEKLEFALESRAVIDQATGVLVERYELAPDRAFQRLAGVSMNTNRKVRDIADHLVHTGELLGAVPPGDGGHSRARSRRGAPDGTQHS